MLKAHSRLFEQLSLAGDLVLIAGCWLLAYFIRFHLSVAAGVPETAVRMICLIMALSSRPITPMS